MEDISVFTIKRCNHSIQPVPVAIKTTLRDWVERNAPPSADTLLGFALDGIIWGKIVDSKLMLAHDVEKRFSRALHPNTLQEVRLFGKSAESSRH